MAGDNYSIEVYDNGFDFGQTIELMYITENQCQQWALEEILDMLTSSATYIKGGNYLESGNTTSYDWGINPSRKTFYKG